MKIEEITGDGRLWSVKYDNQEDNALFMAFDQWTDVQWLRQFFKDNINDLESYFHITNVNQAIYDTIEDSDELECLIMDISPEANLDAIFRPLENSRASEMLLSREKARIQNRPKHASWLRLYAIRVSAGIYIVTGGAIKLTRTMQEREHTLLELQKMEQERSFLMDNDIMDVDSLTDYIEEN